MVQGFEYRDLNLLSPMTTIIIKRFIRRKRENQSNHFKCKVFYNISHSLFLQQQKVFVGNPQTCPTWQSFPQKEQLSKREVSWAGLELLIKTSPIRFKIKQDKWTHKMTANNHQGRKFSFCVWCWLTCNFLPEATQDSTWFYQPTTRPSKLLRALGGVGHCF